MELRKSRYAARYLWGVDFEEQAAKTSRALMLIAGDGHTNIFGPDVDTLEPRTWYRSPSGKSLMENLKRYNLTKEPIPNDELFNDEDNAWKYFEELKFDVILSNPPFAGEVKVKQQLMHYQLAKPAMKRAKDKQAKEERDVLFIERIMKMLKPGGRAAIVLPQGKFNNSSLAFIREWILRKARLLAVVGLHGNSFKPHTGTKTSVLLIQKYTDKELAEILKVQNEVKSACPNYGYQIEALLKKFEAESDIPEDSLPENILELLMEEFSEPEQEVIDETSEESSSGDDLGAESDFEERLEQSANKVYELKTELLRCKERLNGLDDEVEGLTEKHKSELEILKEQKADNRLVQQTKDEHKAQLKALKEAHKEKSRVLKGEIKQFEKELPQAEYEGKLLTNKGKLKLILEDEELLQKLSERFIDAEVAKRLDYSIFMAVSEQGGKNNSGEYEYKIDAFGNLFEDDNGNPVYNQDLVNYSITKEMLIGKSEIEQEYRMAADQPIFNIQPGIAEAFVKFAKDQEFNFWKE
jgi:type I restriction enzyme M protein